MLLPRPQTNTVAGGADPGGAIMHARLGVIAASYSFAAGLFCPPKICTAQERHVRRPPWTDLFFDLVFAAAIAQLSAPLGHDYSFYGIARFTFLLLLVFLAWFGTRLFQHSSR